MTFRFCSLASGSAGNVTVVAHGGALTQTPLTVILIDCGLPYKQLMNRLADRGLAAKDISAIFITHEHSDHIGCGVQLALTHRIPIFMSRGTYTAIGEPAILDLLVLAQDQKALQVNDLVLHPFTVAHDAKEPLQLTISNGNKRLGIVTDLGHVTTHAVQALQNLDALLLEANHEERSLATSQYPAFLKKRIAGDYGHLSNVQAAQLLTRIQSERLHTVVLAHLSEQNNDAQRALAAIQSVSMSAGVSLAVAHQQEGSLWFDV